MNEEEHKAYHRRLLYVVILMLILFFGSATFYHMVEKWRYIDSMYFAAATMTTDGWRLNFFTISKGIASNSPSNARL